MGPGEKEISQTPLQTRKKVIMAETQRSVDDAESMEDERNSKRLANLSNYIKSIPSQRGQDDAKSIASQIMRQRILENYTPVLSDNTDTERALNMMNNLDDMLSQANLQSEID